MKLTKKQLIQLIKEAFPPQEKIGSPEDKLAKLIRTGDPTNIIQAHELAESLGINFETLIDKIADGVMEEHAVYNAVAEVENEVFNIKALALQKFGFAPHVEDLIGESEHTDIEMELVYGVSNHVRTEMREYIRKLVMTIVRGS
jgi:hypothetical protein